MNDPTSEIATPGSHKRSKILRWLAAATLLFLTWFLWQLVGPSPPIIVSKETTYITAPLRPDGTPDYRTYLQDKLRDGVTVENNAAVTMWQVFGPGTDLDAIDAPDWQHIVSELHLSLASHEYLIDPNGQAFANIAGNWIFANDPDWKRAVSSIAEPADNALLDAEALGYEAVGLAMGAPWRKSDLPPLAEWIQENNFLIDQLVEASQRSRMYTPFPPATIGDDVSLIGMPVHSIQRSRAVARILVTRAMLHLGEGQHEEAWRDLAAIHRWARLIAQGPLIIDQLIAIAIDNIACDGDLNLLASQDVPAKVNRQIHQELLHLAPLSNVAERYDQGERIYSLNSIASYRRRGIGTFYADNLSWNLETREPECPAWKTKLLNLVSADWNASFVKANRAFDQIAAATRIPNYQDRQREFKRLSEELYNRDSAPTNLWTWTVGALNRHKRNEMLTETVVAVHTPNFGLAAETQDLAATRIALTQLAAALAVYRAEHREYPERLEQLVPTVIPQPPFDLYHDRPFVYQRDADGYLLYSSGPNGKDDGGSNNLYGVGILAGHKLDWNDNPDTEKLRQQIPAGADDLSIRLPRPPFKLPEPPTTAEVE